MNLKEERRDDRFVREKEKDRQGKEERGKQIGDIEQMK